MNEVITFFKDPGQSGPADLLFLRSQHDDASTVWILPEKSVKKGWFPSIDDDYYRGNLLNFVRECYNTLQQKNVRGWVFLVKTRPDGSEIDCLPPQSFSVGKADCGILVLKPGDFPVWQSVSTHGEKFQLMAGGHLLVPSTRYEETRIQSLMDALEGFTPDLQSVILTAIRNPALETRVMELERKQENGSGIGGSREKPTRPQLPPSFIQTSRFKYLFYLLFILTFINFVAVANSFLPSLIGQDPIVLISSNKSHSGSTNPSSGSQKTLSSGNQQSPDRGQETQKGDNNTDLLLVNFKKVVQGIHFLYLDGTGGFLRLWYTHFLKPIESPSRQKMTLHDKFRSLQTEKSIILGIIKGYLLWKINDEKVAWIDYNFVANPNNYSETKQAFRKYYKKKTLYKKEVDGLSELICMIPDDGKNSLWVLDKRPTLFDFLDHHVECGKPQMKMLGDFLKMFADQLTS